MEELIIKAEQYVFDLFKVKLNSDYTYHNFFHTQFVVSKLNELMEAEKVTPEEAKLLTLAAWFHDTGYIKGQENHEKTGAEIAEEFLKENGLDNSKIETVKNLILSTSMGKTPQNKLEMIIRDADTSNLGDEIFESLTRQMRRELELTRGETISGAEWDQRNYEFLVRGHKYYTDYAKEKWLPIKMDHAMKIQNRLRKRDKSEKSEEEEERNRRLEKLERPGRGIETLFRVTLNNHTRLSDIADSKANILLSVNAIIISIALSTLLPKLTIDGNQYLVIPTMILLFVSVISIIFAIMATRPNITAKRVISEEDIKDRKVNLLFFGNFHRMHLDRFQDAMIDMIADNEYLYNSLTRDLYFLGLVLNRKYRLLRITYNVFLAGTIITVIAFVIAFIQNSGLDGIPD